MCGRVRYASDWSQLRITLRIDEEATPVMRAPSWNIPPTADIITVRLMDGRRQAALMRWGLIPRWSRDGKVGHTFNARADSVATKPSFRGAWKEGRRCLIVADGFYEWRESDRQPFAIGMRDDGLMVMAGLWDWWYPPRGRPVLSTTMITTDANALIGTFHHRMPVILSEPDWPTWLGETPASDDALHALLAPCDPAMIRAWPVHRRVGNVRNDDPRLLDPMPPDPGWLL